MWKNDKSVADSARHDKTQSRRVSNGLFQQRTIEFSAPTAPQLAPYRTDPRSAQSAEVAYSNEAATAAGCQSVCSPGTLGPVTNGRISDGVGAGLTR